MPCASEHESDVTRDKNRTYKALVGHHFHLLPDSSISYEYALTGEYTNAIHRPVCIRDKLRTRLLLPVQNLRPEPSLSGTGTKQHHISSGSCQAS